MCLMSSWGLRCWSRENYGKQNERGNIKNDPIQDEKDKLTIGGKFTMDIQEAAEAALTIKPRVVVPMRIRRNLKTM